MDGSSKSVHVYVLTYIYKSGYQPSDAVGGVSHFAAVVTSCGLPVPFAC